MHVACGIDLRHMYACRIWRRPAFCLPPRKPAAGIHVCVCTLQSVPYRCACYMCMLHVHATCTSMCVHMCTCVRAYVCMRPCTRVEHRWSRTRSTLSALQCTCVHAYMRTCVCVQHRQCIVHGSISVQGVHMRTCAHAYMRTCVHAYMRTCVCVQHRQCIVHGSISVQGAGPVGGLGTVRPRPCTCVHACMYVCMYVRLRPCTCVHVCTGPMCEPLKSTQFWRAALVATEPANMSSASRLASGMGGAGCEAPAGQRSPLAPCPTP